MSKDFIKPVLGRDYHVRPDGSIYVRGTGNPYAAYEDQPIANVLSIVPHDLALKNKEYEARLEAAQLEFRNLMFGPLKEAGRFVLLGFIGYDASGKSGAISRFYEATEKNTKVFRMVSYGVPTADEYRYPWWKRFFDYERFPAKGGVYTLDRFWCERLLVERVKKLDKIEKLNASYAEANMIETLITNAGGILVKFWMNISKETQTERFDDRRDRNSEKYKKEDIEAQKDRPKYNACANEMFARNSNPVPWNIIPADNKKLARVLCLETVNAELRSVLGVK